MTVALARSKYRQAESSGAAQVESPHQVISVTLRELEKSLRVLHAAATAQKSYPEAHLNRAFTAIYILQSSLDFENGGEVANSLFQVYEFARLQVVKAFRREEDANLADASEAISGIYSAWQEIGPKTSGKAT